MKQGKRILIIDDDVEILALYRTLLKQVGYEPSIVANGHDALNIFSQEKPSLVLLDLSMPGLGGLEVLREIRRLDTATPVIILTADTGMESRRACKEMGISAYFTKPPNFDELIETIRCYLDEPQESSKASTTSKNIRRSS